MSSELCVDANTQPNKNRHRENEKEDDKQSGEEGERKAYAGHEMERETFHNAHSQIKRPFGRQVLIEILFTVAICGL